MQYLGTVWGKNVQVCIKPIHFSLQVTKHNIAVLILFSFISLKIHKKIM